MSRLLSCLCPFWRRDNGLDNGEDDEFLGDAIMRRNADMEDALDMIKELNADIETWQTQIESGELGESEGQVLIKRAQLEIRGFHSAIGALRLSGTTAHLREVKARIMESRVREDEGLDELKIAQAAEDTASRFDQLETAGEYCDDLVGNMFEQMNASLELEKIRGVKAWNTVSKKTKGQAAVVRDQENPAKTNPPSKRSSDRNHINVM